jgi:hypothetical protein
VIAFYSAFTPLSGSWLNMAESIQRLLKRRSLMLIAPSGPPPNTS